MTGHKNTEMTVAEAAAAAPASFVIHPLPQGGNFMGKLGIFGLGFVAGVTALAITAAMVEKANTQTPDRSDDDAVEQSQNWIIDVTDYKG